MKIFLDDSCDCYDYTYLDFEIIKIIKIYKKNYLMNIWLYFLQHWIEHKFGNIFL